MMSKIRVAALVAVLFLASTVAAFTQDDTVTRVIIEGNKRIPTDTILSYVTLEEGDTYNEDLLKVDFLQLWNTDFFSNLRIYKERDEQSDGLIVRIEVTERPLVRKVVYRGLKAVSKSKIEENYTEDL